MPIYTYKCTKCGEVFEKFHRMDSNGAENCQICNGETVRVFSPAGIIFKGSGFYTTDYKSGTNKANINSNSPEIPPKSGGEKEKVAAGASQQPACSDSSAVSKSDSPIKDSKTDMKKES